MILVGNQRGGAKNLALHLMKDENEHIEVHELRGFASENLMAALNEAYAMSRATKCRQYLFSLSLNPPPGENVETSVFEDAIERAEKRLGLTGQPRAIIFHEKHGRRHAHAVWSRIDAEKMKAVQLSYSHNKLKALAKELFIERGWKVPRGFIDRNERNPLNYSYTEWQQAKNQRKDPRMIKYDFQDSWIVSDSRDAFARALRERGYWLAQGDARSFVAVDIFGSIHSVARRVGIKTKQLHEKLGEADGLPDVEQARKQIAQEMSAALQRIKEVEYARARKRETSIETRIFALAKKHRAERMAQLESQEKRRISEVKIRQSRFRGGLKGLWDRIRGEHGRIRRRNEREANEALVRNRSERDSLIFRQLEARRRLDLMMSRQIDRTIEISRELNRDMSSLQSEKPEALQFFKNERNKRAQTKPDRPKRRGPEPSR